MGYKNILTSNQTVFLIMGENWLVQTYKYQIILVPNKKKLKLFRIFLQCIKICSKFYSDRQFHEDVKQTKRVGSLIHNVNHVYSNVSLMQKVVAAEIVQTELIHLF